MPEVPPQIPAAARRLATELSDIRGRVERLERGDRAPQLSHAALDGGAVIVKDRAGTPLARLGMQHDERAAVVYARGEPPPTPTAPVVSARQLALVVYWDGTFAGGTARPTDLARVDVHSSETAVYTPDGTTLIGSLVAEGAVSFAGDNDPKHIRLVAVTTSDVASEPTAAVTATPLPADQLAAGSVTAAQLAADILLTSLIRMQDAAGNETLRLDGSDGSAVVSGEYRTANSGSRIVINQGGSNARIIRFYPATGIEHAAIYQLDTGDQLVIKAQNNPTGVCFMEPTFAALGWANIGTTANSQITARETSAQMRSATPYLISDRRFAHDGNGHRIGFFHFDSTGVAISNTTLEHVPLFAANDPALRSAAANVALVWSTPVKDLAVLSYDGSVFKPIRASAFTVSSSRQDKQNIRDLPAPARDIIRDASARQWEYIPAPAKTIHQQAPQDSPTPGVAQTESPPQSETIEHPAEIPARHVGPMAEDLPEWMIRRSPADPNDLAVDVRDMAGVAWAGADEAHQRLDAIEARLAAVEARLPASP